MLSIHKITETTIRFCQSNQIIPITPNKKDRLQTVFFVLWIR
jgi:hypothetical protein